jgi:hypothetical protein
MVRVVSFLVLVYVILHLPSKRYKREIVINGSVISKFYCIMMYQSRRIMKYNESKYEF